eukprot:10868989-Heterocapsa_arctica.AAC.1
MQSLLNIIVMLGKPKGGERPICLAAVLYRLYNKVRTTNVTLWEARKAGFRTAVRGSSPRR